jgi:hypothetical protein
MNRTFPIAWSWVFALILATATGCRQYRMREFVAVQRPVKFENWRLYVNAFVDAANPSPTNHFYRISAMAWTLPGDAYFGDPNAFRPTAYDASLDSLRLFRVEGTNSVELPLPPLHHGSTDHPNRLMQLAPSNGVRIEIPASVSELRADVVMTFRRRETGRTETNVSTMTMRKRERSKLGPIE